MLYWVKYINKITSVLKPILCNLMNTLRIFHMKIVNIVIKISVRKPLTFDSKSTSTGKILISGICHKLIACSLYHCLFCYVLILFCTLYDLNPCVCSGCECKYVCVYIYIYMCVCVCVFVCIDICRGTGGVIYLYFKLQGPSGGSQTYHAMEVRKVRLSHAAFLFSHCVDALL